MKRFSNFAIITLFAMMSTALSSCRSEEPEAVSQSSIDFVSIDRVASIGFQVGEICVKFAG